MQRGQRVKASIVHPFAEGGAPSAWPAAAARRGARGYYDRGATTVGYRPRGRVRAGGAPVARLPW